MAKWYGKIGYAVTEQTSPGIFKESIVTRNYYGDEIRNTRRLQSADQLNDNINISNRLSIVADAYANENIYSMRYAEFKGVKWKITDVEVSFPRLILTLGGIYNG